MILHKLNNIETIYTKIVTENRPIVVSIQDIRKGATIVWEAIKGCFGKGFWRNSKGWINKESWEN